MQTEQSSNLAKVDLLYCPHALRKCGLFETEQTMKSSGWVIVVFEGEHRQFDGEVAYVKGRSINTKTRQIGQSILMTAPRANGKPRLSRCPRLRR
jgi:hypothetical protein